MALQKLRVAVLRGGPSPEYEISLKTGQNILSILRANENAYEPVDIFIDKDGAWHHRGMVTTPDAALRHIDVAWNALHGAYGEDGKVQNILDFHRIPYTGGEAFPSALAMNKVMAKNIYLSNGIHTPMHVVVEAGSDLDIELTKIFRNFMHPVIIKPTNSGSSLGMRLAHTWQELKDGVKSGLENSEKVLIEEYIRGKEATCGIIENFRGEKLYALIPLEIVKPSSMPIFDYESKYSNVVKKQCPGSFSTEENRRIEDAARRAHASLGLRHYSRSDFIITKSGKVYILETNSIPGFTKDSLFPQSLGATGIKENDFVEHLINLAIK